MIDLIPASPKKGIREHWCVEDATINFVQTLQGENRATLAVTTKAGTKVVDKHTFGKGDMVLVICPPGKWEFQYSADSGKTYRTAFYQDSRPAPAEPLRVLVFLDGKRSAPIWSRYRKVETKRARALHMG